MTDTLQAPAPAPVSEFTLTPIAFSVGEDAKDVLTGLEGRIQSIVYHLSGTVQCHVQPLVVAGAEKMAEGYYIDHEALESMGDGVKAKATPCGDPLVKLGWKCKDRISGFEGIVDRIILCFNGCIMVILTGKPNGDGKVTHHHTDHKHVERKGDGLSVDATKPVARAATGCMTTRAPSRSAARL